MSIQDKVYSFPTKHQDGFTIEEMTELLKDFEGINMDAFNNALVGNTCLLIENEIVTYRCDLLTAIYCGMNNREVLPHEFD